MEQLGQEILKIDPVIITGLAGLAVGIMSSNTLRERMRTLKQEDERRNIMLLHEYRIAQILRVAGGAVGGVVVGLIGKALGV